MSETPKIDEATRASITEQYDALIKAQQNIETMMKPFHDAIGQIVTARDLLLEQHGGLEVHGTCEGCDKLLFVGEPGHRCSDGPTLCEDCAPTHADCLQQMKERVGEIDDEEDRRDLQDDIASVEAIVNAGGGDTKAVFPL